MWLVDDRGRATLHIRYCWYLSIGCDLCTMSKMFVAAWTAVVTLQSRSNTISPTDETGGSSSSVLQKNRALRPFGLTGIVIISESWIVKVTAHSRDGVSEDEYKAG